MHKVFIDGKSGTTGLQITDRLRSHDSIEIIEIPEEKRKDPVEKRNYLNNADIVILCLPDSAARESVALISNEKVKILDASSAHRTDKKWTYGLPELISEQRSRIAQSNLVSVPGCYPTGFVLALAPLVRNEIVPENYPVAVHAVSGYSGGGRQLIEKYEEKESREPLEALHVFRPYGFNLNHKHLPEMQKYSGLKKPPVFLPSVGHFYKGMLVMIPFTIDALSPGASVRTITDILQQQYNDEQFVEVFPANHLESLEDGFLSPTVCNDSNRVEIMVFGNESRAIIIVRLDNLGKGASGAAVQNLNLMLGIEESRGLS